MRKLAALFVVPGVLGVALLGRASDHVDAPTATADPVADITDVYTFTSPENPNNLVLIMNVAPFGSAQTFSTKVTYAFRIRKVTDPTQLAVDPMPLDVVCTFVTAATTKVRCTGPYGIQGEANVGDTTGGGTAQSDMRIFAGPRSDPAFFDAVGFQATQVNGKPSFTGENAFNKQNVLSLVVEIDAVKAFGSANGKPSGVLAVAGETIRSGS